MSSRLRNHLEALEQDPKASMADLSVQNIRNMQMIKDVKQALEHGKSLRGRSARSIEFHLKADALKNLSKTEEIADIRKYQRESAQALWDERDHEGMMQERARRFYKTEEDFDHLDELSGELKTLECRTNSYFLDKRYQNKQKKRNERNNYIKTTKTPRPLYRCTVLFLKTSSKLVVKIMNASGAQQRLTVSFYTVA